MAKKLFLADLIKLQLQGVQNLDDDTLRRLEPALVIASEQLQDELLRYSKDQFSYQQRRQTLRLINSSLDNMYQRMEQQIERDAESYNQLAFDSAKEEVKTFNKQVGITTPSA